MLNFEEKFPTSILRHPIAEVLNQISDVLWDLNGISHRDSTGVLQRTVEIIIYFDEQGRHRIATAKIIQWVRNNGLQYSVMSNTDERDPT
jgi:hypothetical protein